MLFSRLPFLPLPTGGNSFYEPSSRMRTRRTFGEWAWCAWRGLSDPTTIAFTHTYTPDQAADALLVGIVDAVAVREIEFAFIRAVLRKVANGNLQNYANSAIVGNLNMPGETSETLSEWSQVFAGVPGTFGGDFGDGWGTAMHAPNDLTGHDPRIHAASRR